MPNAWMSHLAKVYAAGKRKDSAYKYSQAMKDAKKTYKKGSVAKKPKKRRKAKKKVQ
jgi:hypothetical protein